MKRVVYFLLCMSILWVVSCSKTTGKKIGPTITMVADTGGVNDQSFNQGAWEGLNLLLAKNPGITVNYFESKSEADYVPFLQNAVDNGAGLVWAIGYTMAMSVEEVSKANPSSKFGIVDYGFDPSLPNVTAIQFRVEEAAYLAGYLAAKLTKTKKLGFIGAFDTPIIDGFLYGFRAGALAADPGVQIFVQYAASFADSDKGKSIAQTMVDSGADIIFPVAGTTGNGAIELARERNIYVIGVDRDQSYLAPDNMITSVMKRVDNAIAVVSQGFLDGKFEPGTQELGIVDKAVGLAPLNKKIVVDPDLEVAVAALQEEIIAGKINVPKNKSEFLGGGI